MHQDLLLVDDDALQLRMGESFLARLGIAVHTARSGHAAIRRLEDGLRPELIVTDLNMPDGTGIDLLRFLRSSAELGSMPVIVVSGTTDPSEVATVKELGCTALFAKPFSVNRLLERVALVLGLTVRTTDRYTLELTGLLRSAGGERTVVTRDMSVDGALVVTDATVAVGDVIEVELRFPEVSGLGVQPFRGAVVRRGSEAGSYGVRFLGVSDEQRGLLQGFFAGL